LRTNTGVSDYEGWQNELRTSNLWSQLTLRTSYTWSKTTDNVSEIYASGAGAETTIYSQDPLCNVRCEHSLSGQDIPQGWTLGFVENLPFFRDQHGPIGRVLGGWQMAGSYLISSGQTYTPSQSALAANTGAAMTDPVLQSGLDGAMRPFLGSPTAPAWQVGITAADACGNALDGCKNADGSPTKLGVLAAGNPNTLVSWNDINARVNNSTGDTNFYAVTSPKSVRFIVNAAQSQIFYGTPFGTAARNSLRDAPTNIANFAVFKTIRATERVKVRFDATFNNVFNHPNFSSVDAFLDDAGLLQERTGFALPSLFPGTTLTNGQRQITFGLRLDF